MTILDFGFWILDFGLSRQILITSVSLVMPA